MKLLVVLPNNSLGGAEQYLKMMVEYYEGHHIDIYFMRRNNRVAWDSVAHFSNQFYMSSLHEYLGILRFIWIHIWKKKTDYDLVLSSHVFSNALIGGMRKNGLIKTRRLVVRESTSIFLRFKGIKLWLYKMAYKWGYKKIDLLICQTQLMRDQLEEHFPEVTSSIKTEVIPNPVQMEHMITKGMELPEFALPKNYIVSAGRLIHLKGFDLLIKAFSTLKADYPDMKLLILGKGELKDELLQLASSLGIEEDLIMPGHVANVYPFFKNARLNVISSRIEGFPNVLLQMMSQNNRVVSTRCAGGIDEIDGVISCEPDSLEALSSAMLKALKSDTDANRSKFDWYLKARDISDFVNKINQPLA